MLVYVKSTRTQSWRAILRERWVEVVGGFILPILCVILDPFVFRNSLVLPELGIPLLQRFVVFAYADMTLSMVALAYWLRWQVASPLLAGVLCNGALFSLVLGLILLPFSLLGLIVLIGILGLSPFWSSFIFTRACLRVIKVCRETMKPRVIATYTTIGIVIALALPVSLQMGVNALTTLAVQRLVAGDADAASRRTLRWFAWAADLQPVIRAYQQESDEDRKAALSEHYEEITGMSIEHYLRLLAD